MRGVKIVNEVRASVPHVIGDMGRIIQIFHNLVGNACKFTHAGKILLVTTVKVLIFLSALNKG